VLCVLEWFKRRIPDVYVRLTVRPVVLVSSLFGLIVPYRKVIGIPCRRMLVGTSKFKVFLEHLGTTKSSFLVLANTRLVANNSLLFHNLFHESRSHDVDRLGVL
jgi:hypothetical protein